MCDRQPGSGVLHSQGPSFANKHIQRNILVENTESANHKSVICSFGVDQFRSLHRFREPLSF